MQVYHGGVNQWRAREDPGDAGCGWCEEGLRGHKVTCDNFFSSYELGQQLRKRKISMVGTVQKSKPELPPALLASKEREVLSSKFDVTPTTTLISYLWKKTRMLYSLYTQSDISNHEDRKPAIILDYNCNKGSVDNLDEVIETYSCWRMTAHWPLIIFHYIVDVYAYNSFMIWRAINPSWIPHKQNKRRVFLEHLGKALVCPLIKIKEPVPHTEASPAVGKAVQRVYDQPEKFPRQCPSWRK